LVPANQAFFSQKTSCFSAEKAAFGKKYLQADKQPRNNRKTHNQRQENGAKWRIQESNRFFIFFVATRRKQSIN
jgi:hypothetical protein